MKYYEVLPSSAQFHGKTPLTYSFEGDLPIGAVVVVPLRSSDVVGVVITKVSTPKFATKPIIKQVIEATIPQQTLAMLEWLRRYYPAPLGTLAQLVLPSSLLRKRQLAAATRPAAAADLVPLPPLQQQQKEAIRQIEANSGSKPKLGPQSYLLHGDTGTGKTRVYLELALLIYTRPNDTSNSQRL